MTTQEYKAPEPSDTLLDNLPMDIMDSMITGIASQLIVSYMFGKSPSFKNIISKNNLVDGVKMGAAIGAYRRIGRPAVSMMMNRSGLGEMVKL